MKPSGAHTHPEMGGGGPGNVAIAVIAALIFAAVLPSLIRALTSLLEILAITMGAVIVLAIVGGAVVLVWRSRHRQAPTAAVPTVRVLLAGHRRASRPLSTPHPQHLSAPSRAALPAPGARPEIHLHFHGVAADEVAAIIAQHGVPGPSEPDVP